MPSTVTKNLMEIKVSAIVVCFSPRRDELVRLLDSLKTQVSTILVMNNGGISQALLAELKSMPAVRVVDMGGNQGIATALNCGFTMLDQSGAEFGLTFDQDSRPPPNHASALIAAWYRLGAIARKDGRRVGAIGPSFYDTRDGRFDYPFFRAAGWRVEQIFENSGELVPQADVLITSGMLLPLHIWRKFPFLEELFIDHVDTEWCFRTLNAGFQHHGCFDVKMEHELSDAHPIKLFGMTLLKYSHIRRYYFFRNGIFLATRRYVPLTFRLRLIAGLLIRMVTSPFIDVQPGKSIIYIFSGLFDALRGKFGKKHFN